MTHPPATKSIVLTNPETSLHIGGANRSLAEIAAARQPIHYIHKSLADMRPDRVLYEAVPEGEMLFLNYYAQWPDEIAPNFIYHAVYRRLRKVLYGSVTDIEFVEVGVSLETGEVKTVAFEWDPDGRPNSTFPRHHLVVATREESASEKFRVTVRGRQAPPVQIPFEAGRAAILVPVWNHIHDFFRGEGVRLADPPLEPLTEALFQKYWMNKRSLPPSRMRMTAKQNNNS